MDIDGEMNYLREISESSVPQWTVLAPVIFSLAFAVLPFAARRNSVASDTKYTKISLKIYIHSDVA